MCACRLTTSYFVHQVNYHFDYKGREWFLNKYKDHNFGEYNINQILEIVERQLQIRKSDMLAGPKRAAKFHDPKNWHITRKDREIYHWNDDYLEPNLKEFIARIKSSTGTAGSAGQVARAHRVVDELIEEGIIQVIDTKLNSAPIYVFKALKPEIATRVQERIF